MGFLIRRRRTYKIKTAIHLIRIVKSLSFPGLFLRGVWFSSAALKMVTMNMLESSNQGNNPGREHSRRLSAIYSQD